MPYLNEVIIAFLASISVVGAWYMMNNMEEF